MKKLIALLLALVVTCSIATVGTVQAEETIDYANPTITIDGILDEDYPENRVIYDDWWYFFENKQAYDPVDTEFLNNTLRFTWDDDFVYLYYTCEVYPDAPIYQAAEGEKYVDKTTPAELISIYIDTAPSREYASYCQNTKEREKGFCNHFYCNANAGYTCEDTGAAVSLQQDGNGVLHAYDKYGDELALEKNDNAYYRLQTRVAPAFNHWWNYYRSDEGMHLTYDQFVAKRGNENGYYNYSGGLEQAYLDLANGASEAVAFVDYEANMYGCELKYRRDKNQDHFKCNFDVGTQGYEWSDLGPEIPYSEGACLNPWMVPNGEGMFQIYYSEYPIVNNPDNDDPDNNTPEDPAVTAVIDAIMALPAISKVTAQTKAAVDEIEFNMLALNDEQKAQIGADILAKLDGVKAKLAKIELAAKIGDINGDSKADASDALEILKSVVGKVALTVEQNTLADVNADGKADASDALDVLKFVVGKLPAFTASSELLK